MFDKIKDLIDVKSIVTLGLIAAFIAMMFVGTRADDKFVDLFHTITIAVITYYFAKPSSGSTGTPSNTGGNGGNDSGLG